MKPFLLFKAPVKSVSGYGAHSRDILRTIYEMDLFDVKISSTTWGDTPLTALQTDNPFHQWIESNILTSNSVPLPDIFIQVTIPIEFVKFGKISIGITAGIETTMAPKSWIEGCNRPDLIITVSEFSKNTLLNTVYDEDGLEAHQIKINKPIEVLFEGVDTSIYNNQYKGINLEIKEDFAFLFVGHWLQGNLGHDRKDVGMLVKCFALAFQNDINKPALILKTSGPTFSIKDRESIRRKINTIIADIPNPPSIYLLFGELTDMEMNELYNHPKIKCMITFTKGEGFCRPLLEFSMTGKPIIASNWSGHTDFLPMDKAIMLGGIVSPVDPTSISEYIIKDSKWFTVNYDEAVAVMKLITSNYDEFKKKSELLRQENINKFSFEKMKTKMKEILEPFSIRPKAIPFTDLKLPNE